MCLSLYLQNKRTDNLEEIVPMDLKQYWKQEEKKKGQSIVFAGILIYIFPFLAHYKQVYGIKGKRKVREFYGLPPHTYQFLGLGKATWIVTFF